MRTVTKRIMAYVAVAMIGLAGLTACSEDAKSAQSGEADRRQSAYDNMTKNQPAHVPEYSNDRDNINGWVDTWGMSDGKVAYVYLLSSTGDFIGYYVLDGLPTTKCKMITPPFDFEKRDSGDATDADIMVPAPGLSGTYGTGNGECNTYFGFDSSTGAYVEFTVGAAMTMLTFDQPYPMPEGVTPPPPLGFTEVEK